jgi:hypothetical protein
VAIQTNSGGSKSPFRNQHRQAGISMEETQILDWCDFVSGVAIQTSSGLSQPPIRNQTPCDTNREKTSAVTPYQAKENHVFILEQDEIKHNPFTSLGADDT